jgi:hypothetical protein
MKKGTIAIEDEQKEKKYYLKSRRRKLSSY